MVWRVLSLANIRGVPAINDMSWLVSPSPDGTEHHERLESELGSAQREAPTLTFAISVTAGPHGSKEF